MGCEERGNGKLAVKICKVGERCDRMTRKMSIPVFVR